MLNSGLNKSMPAWHNITANFVYLLFKPSPCASLWQICPKGLNNSRLGSDSSGVHHCHSELPIFFSATKTEGRAYVSVSPCWVALYMGAHLVNGKEHKQILISQRAVCLRARKQMRLIDQHPVNRFSLRTGETKAPHHLSFQMKNTKQPSPLCEPL